MKRYNAENRHNFGVFDRLVDVTDTSELYVRTEDVDKDPAVQKKVPLYAMHNVVDKTFFKPGLSSISQTSSSNMKPVYDSLPDGSMPDYGVNIAWVRSKARDRVDVDLALAVVQETIERAQLEDKAELKKAEDAVNKLKALGEVIKESKKSESSEKEAVAEQ